MPIRIICLGKTRETWIKQGLAEYQKRLNRQWQVQWQELKDASLATEGSIEKVKNQEAQILLKALPADAYVIALDEKGSRLTSLALAARLQEVLDHTEAVFVIGGVYGLAESIRTRADFVLSCSDLTFPHQLIRLLLMEQIYRSYAICNGKTYHY